MRKRLLDRLLIPKYIAPLLIAFCAQLESTVQPLLVAGGAGHRVRTLTLVWYINSTESELGRNLRICLLQRVVIGSAICLASTQ